MNFVGTQEQVWIIQVKQAIGVRVIKAYRFTQESHDHSPPKVQDKF